MDAISGLVFSVGPYVGAIVALGVVVFFALTQRKRRKVVSHDDLARFTSKFPLDYLARSLNDHEFNPKEFLGVVRNLFVQFHQGFQEGSIETVRPYLHDDVYNSRMILINARNARHQRAVMKNFKLHGLTIRDATSIGGYDAVTVRILASSADFEIDANGKVFGDKKIRAWEEDWVFERSTSRDTKLSDRWTLTSINAVDRNRFRPDQIRNQYERQMKFRKGESFLS